PARASFPTRRSSDLGLPPFGGGAGQLVHRLGPAGVAGELVEAGHRALRAVMVGAATAKRRSAGSGWTTAVGPSPVTRTRPRPTRSEEHTSELQSREN